MRVTLHGSRTCDPAVVFYVAVAFLPFCSLNLNDFLYTIAEGDCEEDSELAAFATLGDFSALTRTKTLQEKKIIEIYKEMVKLIKKL